MKVIWPHIYYDQYK